MTYAAPAPAGVNRQPAQLLAEMGLDCTRWMALSIEQKGWAMETWAYRNAPAYEAMRAQTPGTYEWVQDGYGLFCRYWQMALHIEVYCRAHQFSTVSLPFQSYYKK